jgi:thiol-disulfide isomerase/thioredoxin
MTTRISRALVSILPLAALSLMAAVASEPRTPAPDFVLHDATGAEVRLSDYKGNVVLLDFWATWCAGCKQEIPYFIDFDASYRDKGLVSIGVALDDEGWKTVTPYLAEHPIPYHIVTSDAAIVKSYQLTNLPVTLLIDREGRIVERHAGIVPREDWEKKIQDLLRESPSN